MIIDKIEKMEKDIADIIKRQKI